MAQNQRFIKKIAVLGAGVMGAQIAAQCVNAGIPCLLYDLPAAEHNKNAIADKAIANLYKLKPSPFGFSQAAQFIQAKNYAENLNELLECDLIIEAIAERLDWKHSLYQQIIPYLNEHAIFVSNTSGLSINKLVEGLPASLQKRFCGMHYFNPPRYMHLVELIPTQKTEPSLVDFLETWLTSRLGKGVIRAYDTPNFIANRIGVVSLLITLYHAKEMQLAPDEVDALTGVLLGRPKSATFRTMDVVGLDTMQHVVHTMQEHLSQDPWHAYFVLPTWLTDLIQAGHLGQKTGQGVYRKKAELIEVFDPLINDYRLSQSEVSPELKEILAITDAQQRMSALNNSSDKQARFIAACYRDLFHYCAYHLESIANNVRDVDLAMRWGFGWTKGPFETWQAAGFEAVLEQIRQGMLNELSMTYAAIPNWMERIQYFYQNDQAFSPKEMNFVPCSHLEVYEKLNWIKKLNQKAETILFENEGIVVANVNDIGFLSFKTKANIVNQAVVDGIFQALELAEHHCSGLVIYQKDEHNFSAGADLKGIAQLIINHDFSGLDKLVKDFQQAMMQIKYSPLPVVAALRGRALGGGCELTMHCDAVVAAFESYPGLVEAGVGLIPAGGGCKEMALRAAQKWGPELFTLVSAYFEQIATARVAGSAIEAKEQGYLRDKDCWVMHKDQVVYAAIYRLKAMLAANYQPQLKAPFKVVGREGAARIRAGLVNWLEGRFISRHDYDLAELLAYVICGGDVDEGQLVTEDWLLKLEREAFLTLAANPLTQARIMNMLETGKPLRN